MSSLLIMSVSIPPMYSRAGGPVKKGPCFRRAMRRIIFVLVPQQKYGRSQGVAMKIPIYQVDAFTDRLFGGNPGRRLPARGMAAGRDDAGHRRGEQPLRNGVLRPEGGRVRDSAGSPRRSRSSWPDTRPWPRPTSSTSTLDYAEPRISFLTKSGELRVERKEGAHPDGFPGFRRRPCRDSRSPGQGPGEEAQGNAQGPGLPRGLRQRERRSWPSGRISPSSKSSIAWASSSRPRATPAISSPGSSPRGPASSRTRSRVRPIRSSSPSGPSG